MTNKFFFTLITITSLSFVAAGCQNQTTAPADSTTPSQQQETTMTISSPAFAANASIPSQYTCDGANINPPLEFKDIPAAAKSLAFILDDPDAPNGTFVHWVLANINPATPGINEHDSLTQASQGNNGTSKTGYIGPCPPSGTHHYHFKLFALDTTLELNQPDAATLTTAMQGHIIGQAELVAVYQKK